jgi:hypothetical protein
MKRLQLAVAAALTCAFASSAMASGTYSFGDGTNAGTTNGKTTFTGSNYGNTETYAAKTGTGPSVTISAFGSNGTGGKLQTAYLNNNYSTNSKTELAITSQGSTGGSGTSELSGGQPNTTNSEHAIDNDGGYEALLLSFTQAVTLASVSIGFPSGGTPDSDMSVLEYVGNAGALNVSGASASLTTLTFADLLTHGWALVSQSTLMNVAVAPDNGTAAINGGTSSQYWMVGAYMAIGANGANTGGYDAVKVNGFSVDTGVGQTKVPEPASIALFGIAGAGLVASRRRRKA